MNFYLIIINIRYFTLTNLNLLKCEITLLIQVWWICDKEENLIGDFWRKTMLKEERK